MYTCVYMYVCIYMEPVSVFVCGFVQVDVDADIREFE